MADFPNFPVALLDALPVSIEAVHHLQIIDDDKIKSVLCLESPRLTAQFSCANGLGIIHQQSVSPAFPEVAHSQAHACFLVLMQHPGRAWRRGAQRPRACSFPK